MTDQSANSAGDVKALAPPPSEKKRPATMGEVLRSLGERRVLITLVVGFGSGLPFLLTGATFGLWLREYGVALSAIGFLSWVGLAYSFKFLWAPVIDRVDAPIFGRLGRRRGWMALTQVSVGLALLAMAVIGPQGGLALLGAAALAVAFSSATQDIAVDAWRIESAESEDDLGLLTSAYQLGYRFAILAANALILFVAAGIGWAGAYGVFGAMMGLALVATLFAREPDRAAPSEAASIWTPRGIWDAIVGPFVAFLQTHKSMALLMLAAISLYRLPDFVMGPMVGPLFVDLGLAKETIGSVRLTIGLAGTLLGIGCGGLSALRLGFNKTLLIGAVVGPGSNLMYAALAIFGASTPLFASTIFIENFSEGFAGAALVAYMSSLTSLGYTATQYALLSSFYALLGKLLKGFSGQVVEALEASYGVSGGYAAFFALTAAVGVPALLLCLLLTARHRQAEARAAEVAQAPT